MYMNEIYKIADQICDTTQNVLITGEMGTGKRTLARYIHDNSAASKSGTFTAVNCSIFIGGICKGETLHADMDQMKSGTLFVDEIEMLDRDMQRQLLHMILNTPEVRVIAATTADLKKQVDKGLFDRDLYDVISDTGVNLPALRNIGTDIEELIEGYVNQYNRKWNMHRSCSPETIQVLAEYSWPGNMREMESVIEHMMIFSKGAYINKEDIPRLDKNISHS